MQSSPTPSCKNYAFSIRQCFRLNSCTLYYDGGILKLSRSILITGGAGFIGGNLVNYWASRHPSDQLVVLDSLTYAGNIKTIDPLIKSEQINFVEGDINDYKLVKEILRKYSVSHLAHLAAESHVDRSISKPSNFITTNILGTFSLLESFRDYWLSSGQPSEWRFLHVSTDEVFGSLDKNDPPFDENTSYSPRSPYSASKASSDHLAMSWFHTYNMPVIISNCSNNYGPYQFPEKLIPLTLTNIIRNIPIPIYGDGLNIRDWLFVEDHCKALELILLNSNPGRTYCIGGKNEISNLQLIQLICDLMDEYLPNKKNNPSRNLMTFVKDRPGHDKRYSINPKRISEQLGWEPDTKLIDGLRKTIIWFIENESWWEPLLTKK